MPRLKQRRFEAIFKPEDWTNTTPWGVQPTHLRLHVTQRPTQTLTDRKAGSSEALIHVKGKEGSGFMLEFFCCSSKGLKAVTGKTKGHSARPGAQRKQFAVVQQWGQCGNGLSKRTYVVPSLPAGSLAWLWDPKGRIQQGFPTHPHPTPLLPGLEAEQVKGGRK